MKIVAVTDPDTALAFRLAGIETYTLKENDDPGPILKGLSRDGETGLVLMTERLAKRAKDVFEQITREKNIPLFIEIPDTKGPAKKRRRTVEKMAAILGR